MDIVITTPTGNIGSHLAERLVESGENITLIARYPEKVAELAAKGARIIQGSHDDQAVIDAATRGAKALFWVTPPNLTSDDLRTHYRRFGEAAAMAIEKNNVQHVVHLSSVGADLDSGTGPVLGLHDNERILSMVAKNIVQLRPGYFMENSLWQIPAIKQTGNLYTALSGSTKVPMIATKDIAKRASELLSDLSWTGHNVVESHGHADISYDDVARALSKVLGRNVTHVQISREQSKQALVQMGASEHIADLFSELAESLKDGCVSFKQPRDSNNTTETSYPVFAGEVFKPAYRAS
ncbi:MAG: NmrA family NAD(P)-binding protein [Proteobacteria bacterium]|nr:NmrA family NAD(P)-binding protein [Pseudomonadota bacterium]